MSNQNAVLNMISGKDTSQIPFTVYENKVMFGNQERQLRNDGMCIVLRQPNFFSSSTKTLETYTITRRNDKGFVEQETIIETPYGRLSSLEIDRGQGHNTWREGFFFKGAEDFRRLRAYFEDLSYITRYDAVLHAIEMAGGDCIPRGKLGYSPMHYLMYDVFGIYEFSMQWCDNRSKIIELYEILRERRRDLYPLAAASPQPLINLCGNVTANVVSPAMFEEYYLPEYNEAAEVLHQAGKYVGVHFDGITRPYADLIRSSALDYIEALTPPPDCDVSPSEAFDLWPEKTIWINFPSSIQMGEPDEIVATIREILSQYRPGKKFLVGITEDVASEKWPTSFRIILDEIRAFNARGQQL